MSYFQELIKRIEALPDSGDGMTVGAIAEAVEASSGDVVCALEEIVARGDLEGK